MPDVKIKGYSGNELHYADVPKVWLAAEESTEDNPVLVPFTYGEAMDDVEIIPDFSDGDMRATVPDGYLARSAVVKRPKTLVPENVAEGVDIAGVVGALAAGGAKIAVGTITGTGEPEILVHGLGVIPDVFAIYRSIAGGYLRNAVGFSAKMIELTNFPAGQWFVADTSPNSGNQSAYIETISQTMPFHDANAQTIIVGGSNSQTRCLKPDSVYNWIAIGGLT